MSKLQFITFSIGVFGLGMIFYFNTSKDTEENKNSIIKTKHYELEDNDEHRKMKIFKHQTWYGDTMLVTIDTTYYYENTIQINNKN
jgi:hypothetical protein